jgi:hypothetical protein
MAKGAARKGLAAAMEAARDHLGDEAGDNGTVGGAETAGNQGDDGESSGDKPRDELTRYVLPEGRSELLANAEAADEREGGAAFRQQFWGELSTELGFDRSTATDPDENGAFFAKPLERAKALDQPAAGAIENLSETAFEARAREMGEAAERGASRFASATLVGDIRDVILEVIKHRPRPWSQLSRDEQNDVATAAEYAAKTVVTRACELIASNGRVSLNAKFEGYSDKAGELKGTLKFVEVDDDGVLALHKASGQMVVLITADPTAFMGERRPPNIEEDQLGLTFEKESDEPMPRPADDSDLAEAGGPEPEPDTEDVLESDAFRRIIADELIANADGLEDARALQIADDVIADSPEGPMCRSAAVALAKAEIDRWPTAA